MMWKDTVFVELMLISQNWLSGSVSSLDLMSFIPFFVKRHN